MFLASLAYDKFAEKVGKKKLLKKQLSIEVCPFQKVLKTTDIWETFLFYVVSTEFHTAFVEFET